jgi:hypothetical protein
MIWQKLSGICVMVVENWKDLERLVEQTMALAKSARDGAAAARPTPFLNAVEQTLAAPNSNPIQKTFAPIVLPAYGREEIKQRVANFSAHQKKMTREREDFYLQTMAKVLAPIKNRS